MMSTSCYCDRCGSLAPLSIFHIDGKPAARYTLYIEDTGTDCMANVRKRWHLCEQCFALAKQFMEGD